MIIPELKDFYLVAGTNLALRYGHRLSVDPTHDKFTLWIQPYKDVGVLEIYDGNGSCIRTERVAQWSQYKKVDISSFSDGVYFCKMRWPGGEGSVKDIKVKE